MDAEQNEVAARQHQRAYGTEEEPLSNSLRLAAKSFLWVEHAAYIALGLLLSATALMALAGGALLLWGGLEDWSSTKTIFDIIDRLLFVLMLIEILHTVRASVRSGALNCEPFLVVGLIASIRRVLVITLKSSEASKQDSMPRWRAAAVRCIDDGTGGAGSADPGHGRLHPLAADTIRFQIQLRSYRRAADMALILNVIWVLLGGFVMAIAWFLAGILAAITIVGLPWARSCFTIASFSLWPFGRTAIDRRALTGREDIGTGPLGLVGNILWLVFLGIWARHRPPGLRGRLRGHHHRHPVRHSAPEACLHQPGPNRACGG